MADLIILSPEERNLALALTTCSFAPATSVKRFVRQLGERVRASDDTKVTPNQQRWLHSLSHSYRGQLPAQLCCLYCPKDAAGRCAAKAKRHA